jgi:hypothetical protein
MQHAVGNVDRRSDRHWVFAALQPDGLMKCCLI